MMIDDNIPDDPELAFLYLEASYRKDYIDAGESTGPNHYPLEEQLRYISRTIAARTELKIDALLEWELPSASDMNDGELYQNFRRDVDHYRTILEIRHSRRNKGLTVRFDATAKSKLRHYVSQIRDVLERIELDDWKRDDLFNALAAFETEVDRDRSRLGIFGDLVVKVGGILGEAAEQAEPVRKWIDSIAKLIWGAEMQERTSSLPKPDERKEIPPPPKRIPAPKKRGDDVPF